MTDRPILFSAPMVRALLAGTKTQTRRALNPQPSEWKAQVIDITKPTFDEDEGGWGQWETEWSTPSLSMPMGEPEREVWRPLKGLRYRCGDRLWVRETLGCRDDRPDFGYGIVSSPYYVYAADDAPVDDQTPAGVSHRPLVPSIHMPRWASRLTLHVTEVRVQRLQDISEADAKAEGVTRIGAEFLARGSTAFDDGPNFYGVETGIGSLNAPSAAGAYRMLWDFLNGDGAWDKNPWVVATTFTVEKINIGQATL